MALDIVKKSRLIKHYKRKDIQRAIADSAVSREIGIRYFDRFGKRPDMITYPGDVWEFVEKGATSFHCSEERWSDPMHLTTGITKGEMDQLRTGWDIVMDIDCKIWEFSKIATKVIIDTIKGFGIESVNCKFSGNKGFHIGIPFEVLPERVWMNNRETDTKLVFPDASRIIFTYLTRKIEPKLTNEIKRIGTDDEIAERLGIDISELFIYRCGHCSGQVSVNQKALYYHICTTPDCAKHSMPIDSETRKARVCKSCKKIMKVEKRDVEKITCPVCHSEIKTNKVLNIAKILALDTQLLSSRHMYRTPYSFHEKSGLISIPVDTEKILEFEKSMAEPEKVTVDEENCFLKIKTDKKEAERLFSEALRFNEEIEERKRRNIDMRRQSVKYSSRDFEPVDVPLSETCFPPCIINGLKGLPDGRKRFLFILMNFLKSVGWDNEKIEEYVYKWNARNPEHLSGSIIRTQLRAHADDNMLPPNCATAGYYKDIGICKPDGVCQRIRNPVSYAKKRARAMPERKAKKKTRVP